LTDELATAARTLCYAAYAIATASYMKARLLASMGASGVAAGLVINATEWAAHRWWLDAAWREAFAALGRAPQGWSSFIPANFWLGMLLIWGYRWLSRHYPRRPGALLRTVVAGWLIFWVIPTLALAPLGFFPNPLLASVIVVGVIDVTLGTLLGVWLYERLAGPMSLT
jgi:hypothetical protein